MPIHDQRRTLRRLLRSSPSVYTAVRSMRRRMLRFEALLRYPPRSARAS
jgi:hypothetical protein